MEDFLGGRGALAGYASRSENYQQLIRHQTPSFIRNVLEAFTNAP